MNFFRKEKITTIVNKKLKKIQKKRYSYTEKQEQLKICLTKIYSDSNAYSIQDIIQRKIYLQTKLDNQNSTKGNMGLAIIVWLALEGSKQLLLVYTTVNFDRNSFFITMMVPFFALGFCSCSSYYLGRVDRNYRTYNLIDFELSIINSILEKHFHYLKTIDDITISYISTLFSTSSTDKPLVLFNEKI